MSLRFEHWIEVATAPVPTRRVPEIVFLVDMILETLDLMPGVEPREPAATA